MRINQLVRGFREDAQPILEPQEFSQSAPSFLEMRSGLRVTMAETEDANLP